VAIFFTLNGILLGEYISRFLTNLAWKRQQNRPNIHNKYLFFIYYINNDLE
jgi:hypothetical protein